MPTSSTEVRTLIDQSRLLGSEGKAQLKQAISALSAAELEQAKQHLQSEGHMLLQGLDAAVQTHLESTPSSPFLHHLDQLMGRGKILLRRAKESDSREDEGPELEKILTELPPDEL